MNRYNIKKFINCVLFFAKKTNPKKLGILKLNKLLYYIDFEHYKKYGRPILGDIYIRMSQGPVPSFSYNLFNIAFKNDGNGMTTASKTLKDVVVVKQERVGDYSINAIYPKKDKIFDRTLFSKSELQIMEKIASKYKNKTGTSISRETHKVDTPWSKTPEMQPIDYNLILDKDSISKEYIDFWREQEKELDSSLVSK